MIESLCRKLSRLGACSGARSWISSQTDATSHQELWERCERGDWMLWILGLLTAGEPYSESRKKLVLAACRCARLKPAFKNAETETFHQECLQTAEKWANGLITNDEIYQLRLLMMQRPDFHALDVAYYTVRTVNSQNTDLTSEVVRYSADEFCSDRVGVYKQAAVIVRELYPQVPSLELRSVTGT